MSSAKCQPFRFGLHVINLPYSITESMPSSRAAASTRTGVTYALTPITPSIIWKKKNIIMYQTVWSYAKRKIYAILVVSYKTTFCVIDMIQWSMMTSSNENIFRVTGLLCGDSPTTGEFRAQRPVTRSYDVFFDLRLNQQLSKQWSRRWFKTPPRSS